MPFQMHRSGMWSIGAAAILIAAAQPVMGGDPLPSVIYSDNVSSDTSLVPGLGGERFSSTAFASLNVSRSGVWWVLNAFVNSSSDTNEVLIRGSGPDGASGVVFAREGFFESAVLPGLNFDNIDTQTDVNDSGVVAFAGDFNGSGNVDDYVLTWDGANYLLHAREGGDSSSIVGTQWGPLSGAQIDNSGRIGFKSNAIQGTPGGTSDDNAYIFDNAVYGQEGVTIPTGQAGGASERMEVFDNERTLFDASGTNSMTMGDLTGATSGDDVVVVNNHVVAQEDSTVGSFASPVSTIQGIYMTNVGDWFVDGSNDDGQDWVLYNGSIFAQTDGATGLSSGENWSDSVLATTFFLMIGNNIGDVIIGGMTDSTDASSDAVLVLNGVTELLREGDAVDLDSDGMPDDNLYINSFREDGAFLTDDGMLYALVSLKNDAGAAAGQAMIVTSIPAPGTLFVVVAAMAGTFARRRRNS